MARTPKKVVKHEYPDIDHPRGRFCLVCACSRCGAFCRDTSTEHALGRGKKKWGEQISDPPRTNGWRIDSGDLCLQCKSICKCQLCGKEGTSHSIRPRSDIWGWNRKDTDDYMTESKSTLCMSCWNKVRALVKREDQIRECTSLLKQIEKERKNGRKNSDDRRTA